MDSNFFKQILRMLECFLWVMGLIGGIGYACYNKAYVIAVAVAVLAAMAFPEAKRAFKKLSNGDE